MVWASDGGEIQPEIPESLRQQGVVTFRDVLKLVVSTTEAPGTLLEQPPLDVTTKSLLMEPEIPESSLAQLFGHLPVARAQAEGHAAGRDRGLDDHADHLHDRPAAGTTATVPGRGGIGPAVRTWSPSKDTPALNATVRLTTLAEGARDVGNLAIPRVFGDHPELGRPFEFASSRSGEPGPSVLELEVADDSYKLVTPAQPFVVNAAIPLRPDETVLPIAYDPGTGLFLPLGRSESRDGTTKIVIERLPDPLGTRDLKGSMKLFFQKMLAEKLSIGDGEVCRLAAASGRAGQARRVRCEPAFGQGESGRGRAHPAVHPRDHGRHPRHGRRARRACPGAWRWKTRPHRSSPATTSSSRSTTKASTRRSKRRRSS